MRFVDMLPALVQAGYNLLHGLWKYSWDADCELFLKILEGQVREDVYFQQTDLQACTCFEHTLLWSVCGSGMHRRPFADASVSELTHRCFLPLVLLSASADIEVRANVYVQQTDLQARATLPWLVCYTCAAGSE